MLLQMLLLHSFYWLKKYSIVYVYHIFFQFSSVHFSYSAMSNSLQPCGMQHTSLPHPSPTPGACSNSRPLSWWCHPTISSSVVPFFSHLQSFPASGSFPKDQFFSSVGQSIGVSASASVLPVNSQDWFPLGTLKGLLQHHSSKASILRCSAFFMVQLSYPTWLLEKL